jgi:multiple antibiotic resistance protein
VVSEGPTQSMLQVAVVAFTTFFATIGPVDLAALFAALTPESTPAHRRAMAIKGTLIAAGILLLFALAGNAVLDYMGISLAALRTAGGILLLLLGIEMVFGRQLGGARSTEEETREAREKQDISVFPLAMPLIAGPGAIGATVLLTAEAMGDILSQTVIIAALMAVLALALAMMLAANQVQKLLGISGLQVVNRTAGVLLSALAVQFIFDGIAESGLFV